jgi:WD40 repeat protein
MNAFHQSIQPPEIPDHELIRCIGEGSYGEIWLAKTVMGIYRAVKIIYRARFEQERSYEREFQGIQRFEPISRSHPGLVDILQIGRNDTAGYYYYIMELADDHDTSRPFDPLTYSAKTLSRHLLQHERLPAAEALDIGRNLAAALAHMHGHGLVHRDIKPANIIFVNAEPKLADIGLVAPVTAGSSYVGTEGYIPPEGPGAVQADIYGLGKVLYEMTTGQDRNAFPELPAGLDQFPDGDQVVELNEVILKACATKPEARHQSAKDLRSELDVLLGGRSVRRLRVVERQLSMVRRVAALAVVLAVIGIIYGVATSYLRSREEKLLAEAYIKDGANLVADRNLHAAAPLFAEALRLQKRRPKDMDTSRVRLGTLAQQSPRLLQFWQMDRMVSDVRFSPDGRHLLIGGRKRAWLMEIETSATVLDIPFGEAIETAVFSPDGKNIAVTDGDRVIVFDARTGLEQFQFRAPGHVYAAEYSPDGERMVVACEDRKAHILNATNGVALQKLRGHRSRLWYANFGPDNNLVVTGGQDETARLWDAMSGEEICPPLVHPSWVFSAAISPDGRQVATSSTDGRLRIWNTNGSLALSAGLDHDAGIRRVAYSPDGRFIISASVDQTVRIWDAKTGQPAGATLNLQAVGMQAVFDADARRVATASASGEIKIWQVRPDAPMNLGPHTKISRNGERYVTLTNNTISLWNARDDSRSAAPQSVSGQMLDLLCNSTGTRVVVPSLDENSGFIMVQVFEPITKGYRWFPIVDSDHWWLNAEGTRLLAGYKRTISCWDTTTGKMIFATNNMPMTAHYVAFASNGRAIALGGGAHSTVLILDAATGDELGRTKVDDKVISLAFSPDATKLVTASGTGHLHPCAAQLWDGRNGQSLGLRLPHAASLMDVQFSHDGRRISTFSRDQRAAVWDATSGQLVFDSILLPSTVCSTEFSPDDRWIVTTTKKLAQVWDAATGQPVTPPFTDPAEFKQAGFCAGGTRLWVSSERGMLLWNLPRHPATPAEWLDLARNLGVTIPSALRQPAGALTTNQLHERCAAERKQTAASLEAWRRDQVDLCEADKDWFAAQFHLEKLLRPSPNDPVLRARWEKAREYLKGTPP